MNWIEEHVICSTCCLNQWASIYQQFAGTYCVLLFVRVGFVRIYSNMQRFVAVVSQRKNTNSVYTNENVGFYSAQGCLQCDDHQTKLLWLFLLCRYTWFDTNG